jgi:hypothetical protein
MEILLALAAAVSYGVSDFAGGVLTRRAHVFVVALVAAYLLRGPGLAGGRRRRGPLTWGGAEGI